MLRDIDQSGSDDSQSFEFASDAFAAEVPLSLPLEPIVEAVPAEDAGKSGQERRRLPRAKYEVTATLSTGGEAAGEFVLYTRDVNSVGSGFVAPLDAISADAATKAPATIAIPTPDGQVRHVRCQIERTREIGEGWVEGYVSFAEPSSVFSSKRINAANADDRKPIFAGA